MLSLVGRGIPDRLRIFMLTVSVVDDVIALIVIATIYADRVDLDPLFTAPGIFALIVVEAAIGIHVGSCMAHCA